MFGTRTDLVSPYGAFRFVDIGVNLLDDMFHGQYHGKQRHQSDILQVLMRAKSMGVQKNIVTAGCVEESINALEFVRSTNEFELYGTVGVHPTRSNEFGKTSGEAEHVINQLSEIIKEGRKDGKVVALGECGLDYDRLHFCKREQQIKGFKLQLELAATVDLPLFLHDRNTGGDFTRMVREYRSYFPRGGVVHSYTGSLEEMHELVDLGLYIGVNGCSLKTEENLRVVAEIPEHLLLIETDAPWCGVKATHASSKYVKTDFPRKRPEKYETGVMVKDRNEPCAIVQVVEVIAAVRGADPHELADRIYQNTQDLFFPPSSVASASASALNADGSSELPSQAT